MNRLFIIGNGFDLAHGLPTSYNHFINNFWCNLFKTYKDEMTKKFVLVDDMNYRYINYSKEVSNFKDFIQNIRDYADEYSCRFEEKTFKLMNESAKYIFNFQNNFFLLINKNQSIDNWVDIENLYYSELKKIVKSKSLDISLSDEDRRRKKKERVEVLNKEFNQIKELLADYLNDLINNYDFDFTQDNEWTKFHKLLSPISLFNNEETLLNEFNKTKDKQIIKEMFEKQSKTGKTNSVSYFLNFNYTPTLNKYLSSLLKGELNVQLNQIHGNIDNEIVFGFGDESDIDYHLIENINDNEFLSFFKSFKYLENNRYNEFLNFIDSKPYQLIIMGHSLGLSDRVLLKTVFENENCKSIKVYYFEGDSGDNFIDLTQNMSRHFSDKSLMRKKVVNKQLCKPLPQINIPLKT